MNIYFSDYKDPSCLGGRVNLTFRRIVGGRRRGEGAKSSGCLLNVACSGQPTWVALRHNCFDSASPRGRISTQPVVNHFGAAEVQKHLQDADRCGLRLGAACFQSGGLGRRKYSSHGECMAGNPTQGHIEEREAKPVEINCMRVAVVVHWAFCMRSLISLIQLKRSRECTETELAGSQLCAVIGMLATCRAPSSGPRDLVCVPV